MGLNDHRVSHEGTRSSASRLEHQPQQQGGSGNEPARREPGFCLQSNDLAAKLFDARVQTSLSVQPAEYEHDKE